jgi:hypothetical protein
MTKRLMRSILAVVVAGLLAPGAVLAATGDHGLPGEFLSYDVGARAAGMGGAMAGLADDVTALVYNPAGLAMQNPVQIGLQHVILFKDTMFDFVGFSLPIPEVGNVGLGAVLLTSTGFDVRDANYLRLATPNSLNQGAVYLGYARDVMTDLAVGATLKVAYENVFGHAGTGIGVDLGSIYTLMPEMQVGLYLNNVLAPKVLGDTYFGGATLGIGGKLFNEALLLDADVSKSFGNQGFKWKVGGQVDLYESMAFFRAGLDDEIRVALGVGGRYMNITLDYSASVEALGLAHKISLGYSFGGYEVRITATPKIFSPVGIKKTTTFAITATSKYAIRSWELNIKDQNGDVIRSFSGEDNPPNQVVWNGKDDRGLPAADGNFSGQLAITDANGKTTKSNLESVRIQSAVPLGDEGTGLSLD